MTIITNFIRNRSRLASREMRRRSLWISLSGMSVAVLMVLTMSSSLGLAQDLQVNRRSTESSSGARGTISSSTKVVHRAKRPILLTVGFGRGPGAPVVDDDAVERVIELVKRHPRRLVTVEFSGTPLRFAALKPDLQKTLVERGGEGTAAQFERYTAGQVEEFIAEIKRREPNAPISIRGIPFIGRSAEVGSTNERFRGVTDGLDALVLDRVLIASSGSDESSLATSLFAQAFDLADGRAVLYSGLGGWRIVLSQETESTVVTPSQRPRAPASSPDATEDEGTRVVASAVDLDDRRLAIPPSEGEARTKGARGGAASGGSSGGSGRSGGGASGGGAGASGGEASGETDPTDPLVLDPEEIASDDIPIGTPIAPEPPESAPIEIDPPFVDPPSGQEEDVWDPIDEIDEPESEDPEEEEVFEDESDQVGDEEDEAGGSDDGGNQSGEGGQDDAEDSSDDVVVDDGADSPVLVPGDGWSGPVLDPGPVGSAGMPGFDAPVIASWDVVPNQIVSEAFDVGLIAFHVNTIDRVEIAVDGGPSVVLAEQRYNERTGVDEYVARLDPSAFSDSSHLAELRAVAYPAGAGRPMALPPLALLVNQPEVEMWCAAWGSDDTGDGTRSNPFRQPGEAMRQHQLGMGGSSVVGGCDGLIVNLLAGDYDATAGTLPYPSTEKGWLTVRADPSVDPSEVRITSGNGIRTRFIRFEGVTFVETLVPSRVLPGGEKQTVWLDEVVSIGDGAGGDLDPIAAPAFAASYITDSLFSELANGPKNITLIRGSMVRSVGEDAYTRCRTIVRCAVEEVKPKPGAHSDVFQIFCDGNAGVNPQMIVYGLTAIEADSQLLLLQDCTELRNLAIVNCALLRPTSFVPSDPPISAVRASVIDNIIFQNVSLPNQPLTFDVGEIRNVSLRSNLFYELRMAAGTPWQNIDAEQNHFISTISHGSVRIGTGSTEGGVAVVGGLLPAVGPMFWTDVVLEDLRPLQGGVLDDRGTWTTALRDVTGKVREIPYTIGGLEADTD